MTIILFAGLLLLGLSFALVMRTLWLGQARQRETMMQIAAYGFRGDATTATPGRDVVFDVRPTFDAVASALGARWLVWLDDHRKRGLRRLLDAAGLYRMAPETFLGYRVLSIASPFAVIAAFVAVGGALGPRMLFAALWLTFIGWLAPTYLIKRRARLRIERVEREVPELVDLLVTTVEAGVAFAGGMQLAARGIKGPLGEELRLVLQEQNLGLTPDQALRNLASRVDSPALRAFTQALIQGESLGVSIGKVMRDLAVDMRKRRRQNAEERAQKTPTKILFPLVGLILPAMFILTLGPVVFRVIRFFAST
jgi:tight adherence protein C